MSEELEGQQQEQEPQPPQAPPIDPNVAIQVAAQHYGVEPTTLVDSLRLQDENRRVYDENRRRARELEIKEAKLEALAQANRRYEPPAPTYDDVDPVTRRILEGQDRLNSRLDSWEQRQREEREQQIQIQEQGAVLHSEYENLMRSTPTQSRMDAQTFFDQMVRLYPGGVPDGLTPAQAVSNTARWLGLHGNGDGAQPSYAPRPINPMRDPRAAIVIPGGGMGAMAQAPGMAEDGPQRPGETLEAYSQRLARVLEERGVRGLRDGARVSTG